MFYNRFPRRIVQSLSCRNSWLETSCTYPVSVENHHIIFPLMICPRCFLSESWWSDVIQSMLCIMVANCHPMEYKFYGLVVAHYFPLLVLTELEPESRQYESCQRTQRCLSSHWDRHTVHCTLRLSWSLHYTVSHACKRECRLFCSDETECTPTTWTDSSTFPGKDHASCTFHELIILRSSYQSDSLRMRIFVSKLMHTSGIMMYALQVTALW